MVVADFDVIGVAVHEMKADAPLIINRNRVLTPPVVLQCVKAIPRGHLEVFKSLSQIHVLQFSNGASRDVSREAPGLAS